jgi:hypothetical protein
VQVKVTCITHLDNIYHNVTKSLAQISMSTPDHLNQISKIISQKLINPKMNELTISQSASNRKHNNIVAQNKMH